MQKTIHLVQVNDKIDTNIILPLALGILWCNANHDADVREKWKLGKVVYKQQPLDQCAEQLAHGDLICFSNYQWNSAYHIELAKKIKNINPNIYIVVGGPDVSPEKTLFWKTFANIFDLAIVGEGEQGITQLLKDFPNINLSSIQGSWTPSFFNGESKRVDNFPTYNSPFLNGFFDSIVAEELANGSTIQAVVQTNRGCPYRCTFCEEGREYKSKMFFYDQQRVLDELTWCAKNKVSFLSIADDNWGIASRDVDFFRHVRNLKLEYGYPEVIDATYAKNAPDRLLEIADIDAEHNTNLVRGFTIALQSLNSKTLKSIKRFNLVPEKQKVLIDGLRSRNMPTYTEIIWPLPFETYESFLQGLDHVLDSGLDNWMGMYPLSLHEGTELYTDFYKDYHFVDQQSHNSAGKEKTFTANNNVVVSSHWVDTNTIIRGQLIYVWLVCLYFFGYGRQGFDWIAKNKNKSICTILDEYINWVDSQSQSILYQYNQKIKKWWEHYYAGHPVPDLSIFNENTIFWSPYAHLASYIQNDINSFYKDFNRFLSANHVPSNITENNQHSVVRYGITYPYTINNIQVSMHDNTVKFDNLYEFCRYYYWWKRKNGWHRTTVTCQ